MTATTPPASTRPPRAAASTEPVPVVGAREPCPCGSGKRYKQCHGRAARARSAAVVLRPFEGLPGEADWVAMREVVPAATATARTRAGAPVTVATVLPGGARAVRREDGEVLLALQVPGGSGDASRDAAAALEAALAAAPGEEVVAAGPPSGGPRLQDLLDPAVPFEVTVHEDHGYWLPAEDGADAAPELREALARAAESIVPTERLRGVEAAYWAQVGGRRHLRWVLPEDEQALLAALARLHVAGDLVVGEGSRYLGAFRAQGLLVPVWDLAPDAGSADVEAPAAALRARLDEALAVTAPLGDAERRARAGVVSRQVTLR